MGTRGDDLAKQFEQAMAELRKAVEDYPEDQWHSVRGPEGWTVAANVHHVGHQFPLELEYLKAGAAGAAMPTHTWDDINARNDKHAEEMRACSKQDALEILNEASSMAAFVRGLSDEQLGRKSALPLANGAMVSTQQMIEGGFLIDHVRAHLKSIQG
jgi:hypothetical protein